MTDLITTKRHMKRVAIIGIQGVPAKYGGFESLVENIIGENCSQNVEYTVFCSGKDYTERRGTYKDVRLKYVNYFHANGWQSTFYDIVSMLRCLSGNYGTVVILGVSGCVFLPVFRLLYHGKIVVNIDGLEHRRDKWAKWQRKFLKCSEALAVRHADVVIADNKGIQDYVTETYGKPSALIAYGGDHVRRDVPQERQEEILGRYKLKQGTYGISVCRIEPENNCHVTLEAFEKTGLPLVFIGNWEHSEYGRMLKKRYQAYRYLRLVDAIYDLEVLYTLRNNARCYVHGHSAGGTNPSLVEAMFFGCPILAYDVVYNRETTHNKAYYYKDCTELETLLANTELNGKEMRMIAEQHYTWKCIAEQYEALY